MKTTLTNFSNIAMNAGFPDLFDFQVDGEILDLNSMTGSVSDETGDRVVEFKIIELIENDEDFLGTVIEYDENDSDLN